MKVILKTDIDVLGEKGEIKEVKAGYARNYLIPNKLAALATSGAIIDLAQKKKDQTRKLAKQLDILKETADKLSKITLTISAEVGSAGKLFGAVTTTDIAEGVKSTCGIEVDRRKIILDSPIKTAGEYLVPIKLAHEIETKIKVIVKAGETPQ